MAMDKNGYFKSSQNIEQINRLSFFFFFKQKTAYEISECDWSSDVSLPISIYFHVTLDFAVPHPTTTLPPAYLYTTRSEERRVGKECRIGCRSRWSPDHSKQNDESSERHSAPGRRPGRRRTALQAWAHPPPRPTRRAHFFFQAEDGIRGF